MLSNTQIVDLLISEVMKNPNQSVISEIRQAIIYRLESTQRRTCPHCDGELQLLERCISCQHMQAVSLEK